MCNDVQDLASLKTCGRSNGEVHPFMLIQGEADVVLLVSVWGNAHL